MVIMQGDSRLVFIALTQMDAALTPEELEDVEVCVGSKLFRRTLEGGSVYWDSESGKWALRLTQEDTFALSPGEHEVIVRVKYKNEPHFDVRGVHVGQITVEKGISREVL